MYALRENFQRACNPVQITGHNRLLCRMTFTVEPFQLALKELRVAVGVPLEDLDDPAVLNKPLPIAGMVFLSRPGHPESLCQLDFREVVKRDDVRFAVASILCC